MVISKIRRRFGDQLQKGIDAFDRGDSAEALRIYYKILEKDETWAAVHYNVGLVTKYQCDWKTSYLHNHRAVELERGNEAAMWNLGIAATALKKWRVARWAWNSFGMDYEESDDIPNGPVGSTPIRLKNNGEVVWSLRLDPARARIVNIPLPESGRRYGEIVLNDGAPNGYREVDGNRYPVFDELQLIEPSEHTTYCFECSLVDPNQIERLRELFGGHDIVVEDWSRSVRYICDECSRGAPKETHDCAQSKPTTSRIGIAAKSEDEMNAIVDRWRRSEEIGVMSRIAL